jgi:hypothetical protein
VKKRNALVVLTSLLPVFPIYGDDAAVLIEDVSKIIEIEPKHSDLNVISL